MRHRVCFILLFCLLAATLTVPLLAQEAVVYGVFFYSPSCPHCHDVINYHWPGIQEEFGDQLRVLFVDASGARGSQIMQQARAALQIEATGVPMLIIGSDVMVGSVEIPRRAPDVIRAGLAAGGMPLPPVPAIQEAYAAAEAFEREQTEAAAGETGEPTAPPVENLSLADRLAADPVANAAAVLMLVLLVSSLLLAFAAYGQSLMGASGRLLQTLNGRPGYFMLSLLSLIGLVLALSLALGSTTDGGVLLLAGGELAVFLVVLVVTLRLRRLPGWLIPLVALAGLAVAGYLAFVEVTLSDAVCGTVGNCNTVQQSEYARVLNIPIGVVGIAGYLGIVAAWLLSRRWKWMDWALVGMCLVGVAFSTYLTFLEPFVIGATCVWCLLSAVWMLMLLWLTLFLRPAAVNTADKAELLAAAPAR